MQRIYQLLPEVEKYLPTEDGLPPLGNALVWAWDTTKKVNTDLVDHKTIFPLELNTMPVGREVRFTGCVIWIHNEKRFASKEAFIGKALIYIGGNEHAPVIVVLSFLE
jgi:leucyl-tRNA synthetase